MSKFSTAANHRSPGGLAPQVVVGWDECAQERVVVVVAEPVSGDDLGDGFAIEVGDSHGAGIVACRELLARK